jgi:membrane fusion protein (multidrug efflux system)
MSMSASPAVCKTRSILAVLAALSLLAACETKPGQQGAGQGQGQGQPAEPPQVLFSKVTKRDWATYLEAVASLDGYVNADIRARVRGYLSTQDYKEGGYVKANQRLFTIERTEQESAVASANAILARGNAAAERTRSQLARVQALFNSGAISQQQIDDAIAAAADAQAQVEGARAQLKQAQLNLSYTELRSPVSGIAGVASVRVGNLVGQEGPTLLTTVSQIDPMRVSFPVSERDYVAYQKRFRQLAERDLPWAQKQFEKLEHGKNAENEDPGVELMLSDGSVYPHRGVVVTAARAFDPSTGTIQLQALIPNPEGLLRPGQYGRVRLRRQQASLMALTVPQKALISVQGQYSLGVIGTDDKVQLRRVRVGESASGTSVIDEGVQEGERIVVEGVQKISDGQRVAAQPAPEATASAADAPSTKTEQPKRVN